MNKGHTIRNAVAVTITGILLTIPAVNAADFVYRHQISESGGSGGAEDPTSGAFVLTSKTYTGNLGGLSGANAECATDLANNDWRGKDKFTAAQISNARAFLCDDNTCAMAKPGLTYTFARSGSTTAGGAEFTADDEGRGTGSEIGFWHTSDTFDASDRFIWTGRNDNDYEGTDNLWTSRPQANGYNCSEWTQGSGGRGQHGYMGTTDERRWSYDWNSCETARQLVCFVD